MVLRVCVRMLGNQAEAEDAAQDTFVKFLRGEFRNESKVSTYLYAIATRVCLDRLRKVKRDERLHRQWRVALEQGTDRAKPRGDNLILITELLQDHELAGELADIAACYYFHGMTEKEISEMTGIKRRTVSYKLARFTKLARKRVGGGENV